MSSAITNDIQVVHSLWIGRKLSNLERLTLRSFARHGHEFHLWTYEELETPVPPGVVLEDAATILPRERVFRYKRPHRWGKAGSVSGFSDIFRYKLLYERGGWWSDMDVTCLKPLAFAAPYVFRRNFPPWVVGNFMKCPPGSELMKRCYERSLTEVTEDNVDWVLPIRILNEEIQRLGLDGYVRDGICVRDDWRLVERLLFRRVALDPENAVVHWMNEQWRSIGIDKDDYKIESTYGDLLAANGVIRGDSGFWRLRLNFLSHLLCYRPARFSVRYYLRYLGRFFVFRLPPFPVSLQIDRCLSYAYHHVCKPAFHHAVRRPAQFARRNLRRLFRNPRKLLEVSRARLGITGRRRDPRRDKSSRKGEAAALVAQYDAGRRGVDTSVLCYAPFVNMHFGLDGRMTACCYNREVVFGRFPETTIRQAWESAEARALRARLAAADLSLGCGLCLEELRGGRRDGSMMALYDRNAGEAVCGNGSPDHPRVFEFELRNTCNLECVMCKGSFSSAIRRNREKLPPLASPYGPAFADEVASFFPHLTDLKFLGGEPLLIDLYHRIWELVAERKPSLRVHITTSASVLPAAVRKILERLNAGFTVSLDSLDPGNHARIRKNSRLETVLRHIDYLRRLAESKGTYVSLAACPMTCNWREMPELVRYANRQGMRISFNNVWWPMALSLRFLPEADLARILEAYAGADLPAATTLQVENRTAFDELRAVIGRWRGQAGACVDRNTLDLLLAALEKEADPHGTGSPLERRVAATFLDPALRAGGDDALPFLAPGDRRAGESLLALAREHGFEALGLAFLSLKRRVREAILGPDRRFASRMKAWTTFFQTSGNQEKIVIDNARKGLQVFMDIMEDASGSRPQAIPLHSREFDSAGTAKIKLHVPNQDVDEAGDRFARMTPAAHFQKFRDVVAGLGSEPIAGAGQRLTASRFFCMAPWSHIHVLPTGKIFPCCMTAQLARNAVGDLRSGDTLRSAWNSPKMRELRRNMLADRPSAMCEHCYDSEQSGLGSFRKAINASMAGHFDLVRRTDAEGRLGVFEVPYLDIRFSNRCNFRCRTCSPELSSGWHDDAVKFGYVEEGSEAEFTAAGGAFIDSVLALAEKAESIFFAGGEPMIMDEHYLVLERLAALGKWDTRIAYNSNCSVLRYKQHDILKLWKRFENILVLASLDDSGARGEYIRKGQNWEVIEKNLVAMRRECPQARLVVAPTVSLFNAIHLPDFFRELVDKRLFQVDEINVNVLRVPAWYSIRNFPPHMKEKLTRRYDDFIAQYLEPSRADEATCDQFRAVVRYMNGGELDELEEFRLMTLEMDEMRQESFRDVFPELLELMEP